MMRLEENREGKKTRMCEEDEEEEEEEGDEEDEILWRLWSGIGRLLSLIDKGRMKMMSIFTSHKTGIDVF